jgi:hypothetical protein
MACVALSILTWIADSYLPLFGSTEYVVLSILGILCFLLACRIVFLSRVRFPSAALCLVGLLVGQWWLTGTLLAFAAWSINGFAP